MQDERWFRQQGDADLDNRSVFNALPHGAAPSDSKSSADHISHSGWGSRFGSGCPGAINVGNTNPLFSSPLMVLLVFQEGGGGKMERRFSSARGQGPAGRRHSSSGMHWTSKKSAPHRNTKCSSLPELLNNKTVSSQLFLQELPSDIILFSCLHPSFPQPNVIITVNYQQ